MAVETLRQGRLMYGAPQISVIEVTTLDIIRTSPENGGQDNEDWWEGAGYNNGARIL